MTHAPRQAGFSLVEVVVALGVTLAVTAAIAELVAQSRRTFDLEPEAADTRQRVRVAVARRRCPGYLHHARQVRVHG